MLLGAVGRGNKGLVATAARPARHKIIKCFLLAPQANSMMKVVILMHSTMERLGCKMMGMHMAAEMANAGIIPPVQVPSFSLFLAK